MRSGLLPRVGVIAAQNKSVEALCRTGNWLRRPSSLIFVAPPCSFFLIEDEMNNFAQLWIGLLVIVLELLFQLADCR
jgi:hypothetical protein